MTKVYAFDEEVIVSEFPIHTVITLHDIKDEYEKRFKIKNTPHLLLIKLHGISFFDLAAQRYIASDEIASLTKAVAILSDKRKGYYQHGNFLIDHFVGVSKLNFPVKLFDKKREAIDWLRMQK